MQDNNKYIRIYAEGVDVSANDDDAMLVVRNVDLEDLISELVASYDFDEIIDAIGCDKVINYVSKLGEDDYDESDEAREREGRY